MNFYHWKAPGPGGRSPFEVLMMTLDICWMWLAFKFLTLIFAEFIFAMWEWLAPSGLLGHLHSW